MFVICKNDYPWAVCPEGTSFETAHAVAGVQQVKENKDCKHTQIYMHVQQAELLTDMQIVQIEGGEAI